MKYADVTLPPSELPSSFRDGPPPRMTEFEGNTAWYRAVEGVGIAKFYPSYYLSNTYHSLRVGTIATLSEGTPTANPTCNLGK